METFKTIELVMFIRDLRKYRSFCDLQKQSGEYRSHSNTTQTLLDFFEEGEKLMATVGFRESKAKIGLICLYMEKNFAEYDISTLAADLRNVEDVLVGELWGKRFVQVNPAYVNNDALFGEQVRAAFPSAKADVREAGNCLAVECNTAAVFHLMRAVEWGLRSLAVHCGLRAVKTRDRKGRRKFKPLVVHPAKLDSRGQV